MRKVKVLALLLAALMVVAVFAGCADTDAIVADVENLDERVEALENLLNNQKDAIDDVKDQLGDVSDKLDNDTTAAQLEAVLKALEEQQKANAELQEQLKELGDKVTEVEKDTEGADDDAALEAAVKVYTAQLQELKITCELKKDLYIAADYEAVVKALSDGIVAVAAAEKADDAKAAFEAAKAVYDAKAIVSSKLAAYFAQVNNTITADSKALIEEIRAYITDDPTTEYVCPVTVKYGTSAATLTNAELLVNNLNGVKETDGTLKKVNVVAELKKAVEAYDYITDTKTTAVFAANVKAAIAAIKAIDVVTYSENLSAAVAAYDAVKVDVLGNATATTTNTNVYAPYVADSVIDLVTNSADLAAAQTRVVELAVAAAMYDTYGAQSASGIASIFAGYKALADATLYTNKPVYDAVDALLNKWIADYKLEAVNVKAIVDSKEVGGFYDGYVLDRHKTALSVKAYSDFAAIVNRIAVLNKLTTVVAANVTEYGEITKAITAWQTLQKADPTADPESVYAIDIPLSATNQAAILAAYELTGTINAATGNFDLYDFVNADVEAFFQNQYAGIKTDYEAVNKNIKKLLADKTASSKYTDIKRHVALEGLYADDDADGNYTKRVVATTDTATIDGTSLTIAAFLKKYEKYDLSSLINLADFEAAKTFTTDRIAGFKAGAANIKTLVDAVEYVALIKTDDVTYAAAQEDAAVGTVYYYVNLSDADAVAKANAAYTAWVNAGATSQLQEWVPALNNKGEVIEDTFTFAPIADAEALRALKQMNEDVAELKADAAKLVAHFELVAEVWNEIKATVDLAADANTAGVDVLTLAKAVLDAGKVNNVYMATPVVVANTTEAAYTVNFNGEKYPLAKKATTVAATEAVGASLQELIHAGYAAYQAFLSKNANIVLKTQSGALVLDKVSKVTDSSVEAALKLIAAAELVMVKDWAMDELRSTSGLDATTVDYYCNWISTVTDLNPQTGNTLWTVAQEIYAKTGVQLGNYTRGTEIKVWGKSVSDYSQAFRAPVYANLG